MNKLTVALSSLALAALCAVPVYAADSSSGPVTCSDGTTSPHGGRGACSKHGGIKKDGAEAKAEAAAPAAKPAAAAKAEPKAAAKEAPAPKAAASTEATGKHSVNGDAAGATAKCKDGSYSHSKTHSGTCSKHGGVAEWLDGSK